MVRRPTQHLLCIAISDYAHWRPLNGPRVDASALLETLAETYAFDPAHIRTLTDDQATARTIRGVLSDWVGADEAARKENARLLGQDDLLIYYAGHGYWDPVFHTGYWIPHNGGTDIAARENWLPHNELLGVLRALPFRHVLLLCDACFAGILLQRDLRVVAERQAQDYPQLASQLRSREVLTSIGEEATPDVAIQGHSAFAFHLLDALKNPQDSWLDKLSLYDRIRRGVPKAMCGDIEQAGHQKGGAFLFHSRHASPRETGSIKMHQAHPPTETVRLVPPALKREKEWFCLSSGNTMGPLSREALLGLIRKGDVDPHSLVWREDWQDWRVLEEVADFSVACMQRNLVWHVATGQEERQIQQEDVAEAIRRGELTPDTLARKEGLAEWRRLREISLFSPLFRYAANPARPFSHVPRSKGTRPPSGAVTDSSEAQAALAAWAEYLQADPVRRTAEGVCFCLVPPVEYREERGRGPAAGFPLLPATEPLWMSVEPVNREILLAAAEAAARSGDHRMQVALRVPAFLAEQSNGGISVSALDLHRLCMYWSGQTGQHYRLPTRREWMRGVAAGVKHSGGSFDSAWGVCSFPGAREWTSTPYPFPGQAPWQEAPPYDGGRKALVVKTVGDWAQDLSMGSETRLEHAQVRLVISVDLE